MPLKFHEKKCEMCAQYKFELEMQQRQTDKFKIAYWKEKREHEKTKLLLKIQNEPDIEY